MTIFLILTIISSETRGNWPMNASEAPAPGLWAAS